MAPSKDAMKTLGFFSGTLFTALTAVIACSAGGSSEGSTIVPAEPGPVVGPPPPGDTNENPPPPTVGLGGAGSLFGDEELEAEDGCDTVLPILLRDFSQAHPDFEMAFQGDEPRLHLVQPDLGADGKPVFLNSVGCPRDNQRQRECNTGFNPTQAVITSADSFAQWYRTIDGTNFAFEREIELAETAPGSGVYTYASNAFFPLTMTEGFGETPQGQGKNFLFTTEIHTRFTYVARQVFTFRGDDDLWIFVNGKLALDLGGMHGEREASIDFDAQAAALGITPGSDYAMDVFHAERHTSQSNFYMETNIACFTPVIPR
jgi:fibro-slime domain-containing protein